MDYIKISEMSGKLEYLNAINSNPLTNDFCKSMVNNKKSICSRCYSCRMLKTFRQTAIPAFNRNDRILSSKVIPVNELPVIMSQIFRFNGHGELINLTHLINYMNIVIKNGYCHFALWTKRANLVRQYCIKYGKPKNLTLIYSNAKMNCQVSKLPIYFDKSFNVYTEDKSRTVNINCQGKCYKCRVCYGHNDVNVINQVIKDKLNITK